MSNVTDMYVRQEPDGSWTLRQVRYRSALLEGKEHPHDVCAVAMAPSEIIGMCKEYWPNADYSAAEGAAAL